MEVYITQTYKYSIYETKVFKYVLTKSTCLLGFGIMDTLISLAGRTGTLRSSLLPSISESAKPRSMSFTAAESKTVVTPSFGRSGALRFSAGG